MTIVKNSIDNPHGFQYLPSFSVFFWDRSVLTSSMSLNGEVTMQGTSMTLPMYVIEVEYVRAIDIDVCRVCPG